MWLLLRRVINKIQNIYRVGVFKQYTNNKEKSICIHGSMTLINKNLKCGDNVNFYPNCMFFGDGLIEIGDNVDIGNNTIIYSSAKGGGVKIGSNTMFAANCYIIDTDHGIAAEPLIRQQQNTSAPISIGSDCWIAAGCKILKGSTIGDGAIIGAMSLVKGNIPEKAIAVGIPAKPMKYRV